MQDRSKKIVQTSLVGIFANLGLVVIKAIVGLFAMSIAIIMDAINNLSDALSSVITIVGTKLAQKKPDEKHPYGHGRVEYLTSLIISIIIIIAGSAAIVESILAIIENNLPQFEIWSVILIAIAVLVKIAISFFFRHRGKKLNSDALKGSGIEALFDAFLSLGTLIAIIVALIWQVNIEGYIGVIIGLFMIKSGIDVLRGSLSNIIGERTSKETSEAIKKLVCSNPEVKGAYDLIVNNYGPDRGIGSIHIEVDDNLTAKEIHSLSRNISEEVYTQYNVMLTVGIYASNTSNEETKEIRVYLANLVKEYPDIKQLHGFYVDKERMLISFDIILEYKCEKVEEIKNELYQKMREKFPLYNCYIVIDNEFAD